MMSTTATKNSLTFSLGLALIYFSLSLWGILHHEIWLDEAHSFTLARDSHSFADLFQNTRQEGHPMLWYILLWSILHYTHQVWSMQLLHIGITALSVFLLARYAPFNKIKQLLFTFSYFFFYEYNLISRNYALCFLWATVYAVLICRTNRNYLLIACALLLLANSHFLGLLLCLPLAAVCLLLLWQERNRQTNGTLIATASILSLGVFIGILQVLPQGESIFSHLPQPSYFSSERFRAFSTPFKALYQFPDLWNPYPWKSNLLTVNKTIGTLFTFLFPLVIIKAFGRNSLSLFILLSTSLLVCLFFYSGLMYNYTVRHWGLIFIAFYLAVWLQEGLDQEYYLNMLKKVPFSRFFQQENKRLTQGLIYSSLVVQFAAAIYFYDLDLKRNFSNAEEAVDYLQQRHYDRDVIILSGYPAGAAVSAYLNKPLYYPEYKGYGSYGLWKVWKWQVSREELLQQLHHFQPIRRAFLLLDRPFDKDKKMSANAIVYQDMQLRIQHLRSFNDGLVKQEQFDLYEIQFPQNQ